MVQKIVLIDDDLEDLELIEESIRTVNPLAQCRTFLDPCDAIDVLAAEPSTPEVIIIDFSMPQMSGMDCLAKLRAMEKLKAVLFVVYSSADLPQSILGNVANEGVVVFKKPNSLKDLENILHTLML